MSDIPIDAPQRLRWASFRRPPPGPRPSSAIPPHPSSIRTGRRTGNIGKLSAADGRGVTVRSRREGRRAKVDYVLRASIPAWGVRRPDEITIKIRALRTTRATFRLSDKDRRRWVALGNKNLRARRTVTLRAGDAKRFVSAGGAVQLRLSRTRRSAFAQKLDLVRLELR